MTIDARSCLLRYGPRKLYAPTPAGNAPLWEIMDLPFLSPTEFVRAKLRCNREYWDLGDISWMVSTPRQTPLAGRSGALTFIDVFDHRADDQLFGPPRPEQVVD